MSDESKGCFIVVLVLMFIIAPLMNMCDGGSSSSTSNSERSKLRKAEKIMKANLNYPNTYKLMGWGVNGNRVTLEFKAKNAFGMEKTERRTIIVD